MTTTDSPTDIEGLVEWRVTTRATIDRVYEVLARNEKEAIAESCDAMPIAEEEIEEETITVTALRARASQ